jgi:hypothetical protein
LIEGRELVGKSEERIAEEQIEEEAERGQHEDRSPERLRLEPGPCGAQTTTPAP